MSSKLYSKALYFPKKEPLKTYTKQKVINRLEQKKIHQKTLMDCCGERGIRTPGTSRYNGFQDRRIRPLC
ncbi:hypothetical protein, partial [uncultured Draconibacterium sp.]|uniref:hypothetical protein n=1 Tax=uncultured Draconibacterium sp. TaxID=1573823 RepID=UPI0025F500FA